MAPFFLFPILFGPSRGGADFTKRCPRCGEPITRMGRFSDRHPAITGISFAMLIVLIGLSIGGLVCSYVGWTVNKDWPDQAPCSLQRPDGKSVCTTYHDYLIYQWQDTLNDLKHL